MGILRALWKVRAPPSCEGARLSAARLGYCGLATLALGVRILRSGGGRYMGHRGARVFGLVVGGRLGSLGFSHV